MRNSVLASLLVAVVPASADADNPKRPESATAAIQVTSSAFASNEPIPSEYTCDGHASAPPPISWSKVPAGTKSIAVLVDDPDAPGGSFTHWLVTGIPASTTSLDKSLPEGATAAKNGVGAMGYWGPCPPAGRHHYYFRVYALDTPLTASNRAEFLSASRGHILAVGQLVGTYEKPPRR